MCDCMVLEIPDSTYKLSEGCRLKLGRFERTIWILHHGWYSYGGNRPVCGWYLVNSDDPSMIKPVSLPDLYDIYLIEF